MLELLPNRAMQISWFSHENKPLDKSLHRLERERSLERQASDDMRDDIRVVIKQDRREKQNGSEKETKRSDRSRSSPVRDRERSKERPEKGKQKKDPKAWNSYKENRAPKESRQDRRRCNVLL